MASDGDDGLSTLASLETELSVADDIALTQVLDRLQAAKVEALQALAMHVCPYAELTECRAGNARLTAENERLTGATCRECGQPMWRRFEGSTYCPYGHLQETP